MKRNIKHLTALVLALVLLLQLMQTGIVFAAEEADKALNPAEQIELTVPEELPAGNHVFLRDGTLTVSERSTETLYIPIQRTGELSAEADVTVKVIDLTARFGVNYDLEVYKDDVEPKVHITDESYVDMFMNAYEQEEVPVTDEDGLGEFLHGAGDAALVNSYGEEIGRASVEPVQAQAEAASSAVAQLKAAGDAYTGTASDRQDMRSESSRRSRSSFPTIRPNPAMRSSPPPSRWRWAIRS